MTLTVQVRQNGDSVGEYRFDAKTATTEQEAVDQFIRHARIDLRYRFLAMDGIITPTFPNDYLTF